MLELLLGEAKVQPAIVEDPGRLRPSDVPVLVGDGTKIRQAVGWEPRIPFEKTLSDLLAYWRARLA